MAVDFEKMAQQGKFVGASEDLSVKLRVVADAIFDADQPSNGVAILAVAHTLAVVIAERYPPGEERQRAGEAALVILRTLLDLYRDAALPARRSRRHD